MIEQEISEHERDLEDGISVYTNRKNQ